MHSNVFSLTSTISFPRGVLFYFILLGRKFISIQTEKKGRGREGCHESLLKNPASSFERCLTRERMEKTEGTSSHVIKNRMGEKMFEAEKNKTKKSIGVQHFRC